MTVGHRPRGTFGLSRIGDGAVPQPQEIAETVEITNVSVPSAASPGETVTVRVNLSCKGAPLVGACEAAIRVSTANETVRVPSSGGEQFSEGSNRTFSADLTMTENDMSITIEGLERGDVAGVWNVEDTAGATVTSATQAEALASNWGPWIVGGGAAGLGGAMVLDEDPLMGAGVGAGVGAGAKVATDRFPTISVPNVGLVELALGGVVLFGGLSLIKRLQDPETTGLGVAESVGTGVGSAASAATGGAGRIAGALRGA